MTQDNVELVRAAIEAYNRGDVESVLNNAAPGLEMDLSRAVGPLHGVYGRDQMLRVWAEIADTWESVQIEPHEFIPVGEDVVVPWTMHLRGRDGIEVQSRVTWVWSFRHGAVERLCMYQRRVEALKAVGLSE